MENNRTECLSVVVSPEKRQEIENIALSENRSLSNFLEWCFDNYKEKLDAVTQ